MLCVDAQGLNLIVAKLAKQFNIPVLYYIAPQEWHWGTKKGGAKVLEVVDHIFSIIKSFSSAKSN